MFPGGVKLRNCVKPAYDVFQCLQGHIIWVARSDRALWSRLASEMPSPGRLSDTETSRRPQESIRRNKEKAGRPFN